MTDLKDRGYRKRTYSGKFKEVSDNPAHKNKRQKTEEEKIIEDELRPIDHDHNKKKCGKKLKRSIDSDQTPNKTPRRSKRLRKYKTGEGDDELLELVFESDYSSEDKSDKSTASSRSDSDEEYDINQHPNILPADVYYNLVHNQDYLNSLPLPLQNDDPVNILQPNPLLEYYSKLTPAERLELDQIEKRLKKHYDNETPLKVRILKLLAPDEIKAKILAKWEHMELIGTSHSEYGKLKKWMDFMLNIPWNKYTKVPVQIEDGYNKINQYLYQIQQHLEATVYGQKEAKSAILELIAQWIINPTSKGLILGFEGPPGTGKTSLMLHGVAYALQRPTVTISLGGARDGALLDGSNQVFEGSTCGKIVDGVIESKCMDPNFYFDEVDKLSESPYGNEIANVLVHFADPTQNHKFEDKYLGVPMNISGSTIVFSFNDRRLINPILRDRIKIIKFTGYNIEDKIQIATNYSLPKIYKEWGFKKDDIYFPNDILEYIVKTYTKEEEGIRNLVHCLEMIVSKLNLFRIQDSKYFRENFATKSNQTQTSTNLAPSEPKKKIILAPSEPKKKIILASEEKHTQGEKLKHTLLESDENSDTTPLENQKLNLHYELPDISFPLEVTREIVDILINFTLDQDDDNDILLDIPCQPILHYKSY